MSAMVKKHLQTYTEIQYKYQNLYNSYQFVHWYDYLHNIAWTLLNKHSFKSILLE